MTLPVLLEPAVSVVVLTLAGLGWGGLLLRGLGLGAVGVAWAAPLGLGLLGWLGFLLAAGGWFTPPALIGLVVLPGLAGLLTLRPAAGGNPAGRWDPVTLALAGLVGLIALGSLLQGLCPPADADSLAYHFLLARRMAESGHLVFEPRAIDGAAPLLIQTVHALAFALGGERALTLWCAVTGWVAAPLLHHLVAARCGRTWGLAAVALWMTTPTMLYAAGTGQVEPRTAGFALAAIAAVAGCGGAGQGRRWAALAGLCAGFYAGSKYPGLLLVAVAGGALLLRGRDLTAGVGFGLAAVLAGGQWYVWNALNSGNPVFPLFYPLIPIRPELWNPAQNAYFLDSFRQAEMVFDRDLVNLLLYPLRATFTPPPLIEAGRTGLGLFPLLALPLALAAALAWARRGGRWWASPLLALAAIAAATAAAWFLFGSSQRVRHLLPMLPAVLVTLMVALARLRALVPGLAVPAAATVTLCLGLGLGGLGLADVKYAGALIRGDDRATFLAHNVAGATAAAEINRLLPAEARLFNPERQLGYLIERPSFIAHPLFQAVVEIRPDNVDPALYWRQLRHAGFTHVLSYPSAQVGGSLYGLSRALVEAGCGTVARVMPFRAIDSRTFPTLGRGAENQLLLIRLTPDTCPWPDVVPPSRLPFSP